ncbi:luminal-binding protein 5-like [Panicum hallii]|uniref:luminal-binding protein 5-like n=1 Tax=Panicum hallii TaxID=206008 RepID=UPI000DF4D036|nr:luminal-binding protein 5-like [Panicum hallii]
MARQDVAPVRALVWLLALAALGKAAALFDQEWPSDPAMYPPGRVIAVDLGNTNSCVAGYGSGQTQTMFQLCIPSWVAFADDGAVLVGEDARNHAAVNPQATVSGFKRLLGKRLTRVFEREFAQRVKENLSYKVDVEKDVWPHIQVTTSDGAVRLLGLEKLTAMVVAKLKETAEAYLGHRVNAAIFTLPLEFSNEVQGRRVLRRPGGLPASRP